MEERYIATVDLGTSKLALSVAKVTGDSMEILYYKETPSDGVRRGGIFNPTKASAPLVQAIKNAEDELCIKITQVVTGLPRYGVSQEISSARIERGDKESCITQEEIDAIKNMALDTYPLDDPEHQEIYGAAAQSFSTDDAINCTEEDVVGMPSSVLEGNFKVFVGEKAASRNIDIMLNQAKVASASKYFLPTITAEAVLISEEKENGIALVEIGAGVSSVTIYQGGILRYYSSIPFGGRSITNDIKAECGFGERLAENVKLGFGSCMPDKLQNMSDKILQIKDEENGTDQLLPVKYLSEIITSRMREIVDALLFRIQESGYADRLRNGVVLTGGCAELAGCGNLIKEMSGYNVRIGYPRTRKFSSEGCPGIAGAGAVSTIGLLLLAKEDTHLNCVEQTPIAGGTISRGSASARSAAAAASKGPAKVEEPVEKDTPPEEEQDLGGTVFDKVDDSQRKAAKSRRPKPQKEPREARDGGSSLLFKWTKKAIKPIEGWVGELYDKVQDN